MTEYARFRPGGITEKLERAHRTFLGRASDRRLGNDHCVAKCQGKDDINKQESAAAVFCSQIRESPDIAQADGSARGRENKSELTCK